MALGDIIDPRQLVVAGTAMQGQSAMHGAPVPVIPAPPQPVPPISQGVDGPAYTPLPPPSGPPKQLSSREQYRQLHPEYKFADEQAKDTGPSAMSRLGDWLRSKKEPAKQLAKDVALGIAMPGVGQIATNPYAQQLVQSRLPDAPPMADDATGAGLGPVEGPNGVASRSPEQSQQPAQPAMLHVDATSTNLIDPKDREAVDATYGQEANAIGQQQDANNSLADAQGDAEKAVAGKYDQASNQIQDNAAEMQHEANKQRHLEADWSKRIDRASADLAAMHEDKNRLWNSKSTGSKIATGISLALGGFVQGASNGAVRNAGLDMLNRDVDLDLESQRKDHDLARGRVGDMKNLYSEAYKASGNHAQAMIDARAMAISHIQSEMSAIAARSNSKQLMDRARGMNAILEQQKAQLFRQNAMWDASTKKYVDAHWAANPAVPKVDWKEQREISEDLEKGRVPGAEGAPGPVQQLLNQGKTPSRFERFVDAVTPDAMPSLKPDNVRATKAYVHQLALAGAGEEGMKGTGIVEGLEHTYYGNGSPEDIQRGHDMAMAAIRSRTTNAQAGHRPDQVALHEGGRVMAPVPIQQRTGANQTPASALDRLRRKHEQQ